MKYRVIRTSNDELYHYGRKGMKWGQHIFGDDKRYGSKSATKTKNPDSDRDHSKSDKSPAAYFLAMMALDIMRLNPYGLAYDTKRLIQYGESAVKTKLYNKERQQCNVDKKTGFLLKNNTDESFKHDAVRVNPQLYNFDKNTKNNCMLCTSAYDLRRRGYEVQAKKASYGYVVEDVNAWYPNVKIRQVKGVDAKGRPSIKAMTHNIKNELVSQGDGARGNLMITWRNMRGGHSVAYEVQNGKVVIVDAQIGKVYNNPDVFLKQCNASVEYARLDNVNFSAKNIREVAE